MKKYRITIKKSYVDLSFDFDDFECATIFIEYVVNNMVKEDNDKEVEVLINKIEEGEA